MKNNPIFDLVAFILVIIGGINWGLIGLFKLNLIGGILGEGFIGRIIYILIGVGAGYLAYMKWFQKKSA